KESVPAINRNIIYHPMFAKASDVLSQPFKHTENSYDEYKDQVLLPHMLTKTGPFIATGDVNKDGTEDFYVGGAANQSGALYLQVGDKLVKQKIPAFETDKAFEDIGTLFFDADNDGDLDLYVVSGGSEYKEGSDMYQDRLYINDGKGNFTRGVLPKTMSSGSCIAAYDFDGDGDLDLFRGGQVVPHSYPSAPRSYVFVNDHGKFVDRTMDVAPALAQAGMVNSAIWADLNGDKKAELIIAGEWMPIKIYESGSGKLNDVSNNYGLKNTEGWWNKLVADDIDGDGDIDIIAGNLGENYKFKASVEKPFEVYAKDFDNNGTNDIFLAKYNGDVQVPVRGRECTSQQCPFISQKFPSFLAFAESDLKTILGEQIESALHYKAHLFSSVILVNDHGKFTIKKLPVEAQFSTVNCIMVKDFDKDGKKDILIAGNKFDVEVETTPADASPGLFLKGLGNMNFQSEKPLESGFFIPYNVKDMQAVKSKDAWNILVSSNDDSLRVFKTVK
ncbi:MAG: VCBS repeat-containing protein, partial [Chitinophagaceae bacterium]